VFVSSSQLLFILQSSIFPSHLKALVSPLPLPLKPTQPNQPKLKELSMHRKHALHRIESHRIAS